MATPQDGPNWHTPPYQGMENDPIEYDANWRRGSSIQRPNLGTTVSGRPIDVRVVDVTDRAIRALSNLQIAVDRISQVASPELIQSQAKTAQDLNQQLEKGNRTRNTRLTQEKQITDELKKQTRSLQNQVKEDERRAKIQREVARTMQIGAIAVQRELAQQGFKTGTGQTAQFHYLRRTPGGVKPVSLAADEMRQLFAAQRAGTATQAQRRQLADIEQTLVQAGTQRATANNANDPRMRIKELLNALGHGNIGAALGELFQRTSTQERIGARVAGMGERLQGLRIGGRTLGQIPGVGSLVGRAFPAMGAAIATPLGIAASGLYAARRVNQQVQETRQIGMITGEGFGAGLGARAAAFRMGINPFDTLSGRQAMEIEMGVRSLGYRGRGADTLAGAIAGITKDLGTDFKQSIQIADVALNQGNSSISEFSGIMHQLDSTARATGASVANIQEALATLQQSMVEHGATTRQVSTQFNAAQTVLRGTDLARHPQVTAAWMGNVQPLIAMAAGVPIWRAYMMGAQQWGASLDRLIDQYLRQKPDGMGLREYASLLVTTGAPLFQGLDVPQAQQLLQRRSKGGSFAQQAERAGYFGGLHAARARETAISANYDQSRGAGTRGSLTAYRHERSAERAYMAILQQSAIQAGVPRAEVSRILAPLRAAAITRQGQSNDPFQSAQGSVERNLRDAVRHVRISLAPDAKKYFSAINTAETDWFYGKRSSVGVTSTP